MTTTPKPPSVEDLLDRLLKLREKRPKPGVHSPGYELEFENLLMDMISVGLIRVDNAIKALERVATSLEAKGDLIVTFSDLSRKIEELTTRIGGFRGR